MTESRQARGEQSSLIKRRVFSRGTVFLLISLLMIGGWRLLHPPKVTIQRQVDISGEMHFERKPALSDLLSWSKDLNLREAQEVSLKKLLQEEQLQVKPIEEEIGKVTQEFNQFATQRQSKSAGMEEFQAAAQPISALSRDKRQIEQSFAEQGLGILDTPQRETARQLWEATLTRMRGGKKEVVNP
jgi:hypothetical protein